MTIQRTAVLGFIVIAFIAAGKPPAPQPEATISAAPDSERFAALHDEIEGQKKSLDKIGESVKKIEKNTEKNVIEDLAYDWFKETILSVLPHPFEEKKQETGAIAYAGSGVVLTTIRFLVRNRKTARAVTSVLLAGYSVSLWLFFSGIVWFTLRGASHPTAAAAQTASVDTRALKEQIAVVGNKIDQLRADIQRTGSNVPQPVVAHAELLPQIADDAKGIRTDTQNLRGRWSTWLLWLLNTLALGFIALKVWEKV